MKKFVFIMMGIFIIGGMTFIVNGTVLADENIPKIKAAVVLDEPIYYPGEPINIILSIANEGDVDVITSKGFSDTAFALLLRFIDDKENVITTDSVTNESKAVATTPGPPIVFLNEYGALVQGEPVEILAPKNADGSYGWVASFPSFNALDFYPLEGKSGYFTVQAVIPMTTYPDTSVEGDPGKEYVLLDSADWRGTIESNITNFILIGDADGDGYFYPEPPPGDSNPADCDDADPDVNPGMSEILANGIDDDCNAETPDVVSVENDGVIEIKAYTHTVGPGTHPGSLKEPMAEMPVRIYDKSTGSCVSEYGVSWQHYQTVWENCYPVVIGDTDNDGTIEFSVQPGDYIVIARYDPAENEDEIYLGVSIGVVDPGATIQKYLQMIVKSDGKKVPAKYFKKQGSELLVIEPEYIEWDGIQEGYPFVFDSSGDWTVSTAVSPPEGFVADNETLSEEVSSEVEAVQFTITDIGSEWVSTGVVHIVKHRNKTEKIQSKIGIKLSKKLAKAKGLSIFGEKIKNVSPKDNKTDKNHKNKED